MILLFGSILFISYLVNERDEAVRVVAFIAACKGMEIKKGHEGGILDDTCRLRGADGAVIDGNLWGRYR